MKQTRSRRALTSVLCGLFLLSTLTASFIVPNIASAETIIIESCNAGMIELRTGDHLLCVDPTQGDGGGSGTQTAPGDGAGYGDGAGGGRPRPTRAELLRRRRCKQCKAASEACVTQAFFAGDTCRINAAAQAAYRCDILKRGELNTVTAWGCSIWDHVSEQCPGVEAPFNNPQRWEYGCRTEGGIRSCDGRGVDSCVDSWRRSHPSGSTTVTNSGEVTVELPGVGAQANQTVTETYSWNGRSGYGVVCEAVSMSFLHRCTARETACYQASSCTAADL